MKRTTFLKTLGLVGASLGTAHELFAENHYDQTKAPNDFLRKKWSESMRQKIELQKQGAKPVTAQWLKDRAEGRHISGKLNETFLAEARKKLKEPAKYSSGRLIKIGDYLLYGMYVRVSQKDNDMAELSFDMLTFHEDEIGVIYDSEEDNSRYASSASKTKFIYLKKL
jgi:hypothetical protein